MSKKELEQLSDDDLFLDSSDSPLLPTDVERQYQFQEIFKNILPYLGSHDGKIVLAQVMIALKLEGIIGKELGDQDYEMLKVVKDAVLAEPIQRQRALKWAQKLLK
ncbi:MAG: hypothetical protein ACI9BD_001604 [Candidatus Marinamargulisbacteria bacterium]|jgi:hypothetical protein